MNPSPFEQQYVRPPQQIPIYHPPNPNVNQNLPYYPNNNTYIARHFEVVDDRRYPTQSPMSSQNYPPIIQSNYKIPQNRQGPTQNYQMNRPSYKKQQQMQIDSRQQINEQQNGYQYPEEQYEYEQVQNSQEGSQQEHNQQIILFWEHKFYTIYQRFQWVHDKVEWMRTEFYNLNNQLKAVDSEVEWNDAKQHHEDYIQQLEQFSQELTGVLNENQTLLQQREIQGEENGVWKQRYYELFESYKMIQQELTELKEGKSESENKVFDEEKYEEFIDNYKMLERQYSQVINELEEYKRKENNSDEIKQYRSKLDFALKQAEKYRDILDKLHEENQQMNGIIEELKEKNEAYQKNNIQYEINRYAQALEERQNDLQNLNGQIEQLHHAYQNLFKQNEFLEEQEKQKSRQVEQLTSNILEFKANYKSVTAVTEEYQQILSSKNNELQQKNQLLQKLRKEPSTLGRSESMREIVKKDYEQRLEKLQNQYQGRIFELKKKLKQKEQQMQISTLMQIKLESSQKKIKLYNEQIKNLTHNLEEREKENSQLKRFGFQVQKLRGIQIQYNYLLEERDNLNGLLHQRNYDIENLQVQLMEFQQRIKQIGEKNTNSQSKILISEIEELNEIIRSKDTEITKLKSSFVLKEEYVRELEGDIESVRNDMSSREKLYQNQKEILLEKITNLQRKNAQLQKKMKEVEHDFGAHMIKNLQEQIKILRLQNQSKQQAIIQMEGEQLELRSKISHYERIRGSHDNDIEELELRIRQLENSKSQLLKKLEVSLREVKSREREMKEYYENQVQLKKNLKTCENQLEESEGFLMEKEKIIKQLQIKLMSSNNQLESLTKDNDMVKTKRKQENEASSRELDDLKRKIFEYQHKQSSQKELELRHQDSLTKLQSTLVKQLKAQNQILKSQLNSAFEGLNGEVPSVKKKESANIIHQRLFDFNSRLDEMITENKSLNMSSNFEKSFPRPQKYNETVKINDKWKKSKQSKEPVFVQEQEKILSDQNEFYKQKIAELQSRIENLIKVNTNLKGRLDGLLRAGKEPSSLSFYKNQLEDAEQTIENLNRKLKKALQENRTFKLNNSESTTNLCRNYEDKIFEYENKIFTLERKLANVELERIKSENQKANLTRNIKIYESQMGSLRESFEKKLSRAVSSKEELNSQINGMTNKINILELQNSRLKIAQSPKNSQKIVLNSPSRSYRQG